MNKKWKTTAGMTALLFLLLFTGGCSGSPSITIDTPGDLSAVLAEGAGDDYSYYAVKEFAPQNWEDMLNGSLWICSKDDLKRPPLLPSGIVNFLNGGSLAAGTVINLEWSDQVDAPDSAELGIASITASYGLTYEGCVETALDEMRSSGQPALLLTDTAGAFDGKEDLQIVRFK